MKVLTAARFLIALGWRLDRRRLLRAVTLMFAGYVAAPLAALALADFVDDILGHRGGSALVLAVVAAVLLVAQLMCGHFAHLDYFELAELQETGLRVELVEPVNGPTGIEHLDDPQVADYVDLVRTGLFSSTRALEGVLQLTGLLLQTAITAGILIHLDPWLAFLPVFAIPPVLLGRRAQTILEAAREHTAEKVRLNRHLIELATTVSSAKELRLFGTEGEVLRAKRMPGTRSPIGCGRRRRRAPGCAPSASSCSPSATAAPSSSSCARRARATPASAVSCSSSRWRSR